MYKFYGIFLILMSSTFFGIMGPLAQIAKSDGMKQSSILALRFLMSALLLSLWVFHKKYHKNIKIRSLTTPFLMGFIGYFALAHSYFSAIDYVGAGMTSILLYTYPTIIAIYQIVTKQEKLNFKLSLSLSCAFIGVLLCLPSLDINLQSNFGVVLGLSASLAYAIYLLVGNYTIKNISPYIVSTMVCLGSSVSFSIQAIFFEGVTLPHSINALYSILALAFFSTVLAILFLFKGMELIKVSHASILSAFEPLVAVTAGMIFLGESMLPHQLLGFTLILASILVISKK